jgi:hypothetical protein
LGIFFVALLGSLGVCRLLGIEPWWQAALREVRAARAANAKIYTETENAPWRDEGPVTKHVKTLVSLDRDKGLTLARYDLDDGRQTEQSDFYLINNGDRPIYIFVGEDRVPVGLGFGHLRREVLLKTNNIRPKALAPGEQYVFLLPFGLDERLTVTLPFTRDGESELATFRQ